jgi:hypothetical protein
MQLKNAVAYVGRRSNPRICPKEAMMRKRNAAVIAAGALVLGACGAWAVAGVLSVPQVRIKDLQQPAATVVAAVIAAVAAVAAAVSALVGAIYSGRQAKRSADAAMETVDLNREKSRDDARAKLYQDAATQLGHDKAAVRFAGVYALSRLADDWPEQRQACIEVLCAYLRMQSRQVQNMAGQPKNGQPKNGQTAEGQPADAGDISVRLAIQRVIREHLQEGVKNSWSDCRLNFKNAVLDSFGMEGAVFNRAVDFNKSTFTGRCNLRDATFNDRLLLTGVKIEEGQLDISPKRLAKVALDATDKRPELDLSRVTLVRGGHLLLNYTPADGASVRVDMSDLVAEDAVVDVELGDPARQSSVHLNGSRWRVTGSSTVRVKSLDGEGAAPNMDPPAEWDLNWRSQPNNSNLLGHQPAAVSE